LRSKHTMSPFSIRPDGPIFAVFATKCRRFWSRCHDNFNISRRHISLSYYVPATILSQFCLVPSFSVLSFLK
jgi:hypothetical protein